MASLASIDKWQLHTLKSKPFVFELPFNSGDKIEVAAVDQNGDRMVAQLV